MPLIITTTIFPNLTRVGGEHIKPVSFARRLRFDVNFDLISSLISEV